MVIGLMGFNSSSSALAFSLVRLDDEKTVRIAGKNNSTNAQGNVTLTTRWRVVTLS